MPDLAPLGYERAPNRWRGVPRAIGRPGTGWLPEPPWKVVQAHPPDRATEGATLKPASRARWASSRAPKLRFGETNP